MKRRHFLQFASSTLTTLGISQTHFLQQADRYGQAIATSTPRKLALLIGINDYKDGITSLKGCVTDVEMQYELLVHRYGFQPADIMIIADRLPRYAKQATLILPSRQNILDAIESHLIKQAKPGDVVVIHYSGHGALVGQNATIVPNDRIIPNSQTVDDISDDTLTLLRQRINTDNITLILDSCYSGGAIRGSAETVRSLQNRPSLSGRSATLSRDETDLRSRLLRETKTSLQEIQYNPKGILIGAVGAGQLALDCVYGDETDQTRFHAGGFSYLLTRYLWQASGRTPAATIVDESIAISVKAEVGNVAPVVEGRDRQKPMYFQVPDMPSADAVIQEVQGSKIDFWLGGETAFQLNSSNRGSIWSVFNQQGQIVGEIEQTGRQGLYATGTVRSTKSPLQAGMFLRKRIRLIPANFKLKLGKHPSWQSPSLTPIQTDIVNAINKLDFIQWVEDIKQADCLLGRMTDELLTKSETPSDRENIQIGNYGLLTYAHRPLWDSFRQKRQLKIDSDLAAWLQHLVAVKYLKLSLGTKALWESASPSSDTAHKKNPTKLTSAVVPFGQDNLWETQKELPTGSYAQINLRNDGKKALYVVALTISTDGLIKILYPHDSASSQSLTLLPVDSGKNIVIDRSSKGQGHPLFGTGPIEVLVISSETSLEETYSLLLQFPQIRSANPIEVDKLGATWHRIDVKPKST